MPLRGRIASHRVVLVDGVDAFEIFVSEGYKRKTSQCLDIDTIDIEVFDAVEMTLSGLVG